MILRALLFLTVAFCKAPKVAAYEVSGSYLMSPCSSQLYCESRLLDLVQTTNMFGNSKTFVDMATKTSTDEVIVEWEKLMKEKNDEPQPPDVQAFVSQHMMNISGLNNWEPKDFNPEPYFIRTIKDEKIKAMAKYAIGLWKTMGRKIEQDTEELRSSLLYMPNGYIMKNSLYPEYYYWDSYWVIEGLLLCEMDETAKGIIENFIYLIKHHGFVPQGGRVYYTSRSQPPVLAFMVWRYLLKTRNFDWLQTVVKYIDHELQHWVDNNMKGGKINDINHVWFVYQSDSRGPRPENYYEDYKAAERFSDSEDERQELYNHMKAGASSGWDFSSRWMMDDEGNFAKGLEYVKTKRIAPVDLNSILYGAFMRVSSMYLILENYERRAFWYDLAQKVKITIQQLMWNEADGIWYDFDTVTKKQRTRFAASNLTPLWVGAYNNTACKKGDQGYRVARYMMKLGINLYKGGVPATLENTGQKWDFPNAWPPVQSIVVQGLRRSKHPIALLLANQLGKFWVQAHYKSWKDHGLFFDYYNAANPGQTTDGRTYNEQTGGWVAAVLLDFINTYYASKQKKESVVVIA